jgi:hypothetical protein
MDDDGSALRVGKISLLRCFGQFFSYVICFYEKLITVNYFWQNKVVLTLLSSPILTPGKNVFSVHSK